MPLPSNKRHLRDLTFLPPLHAGRHMSSTFLNNGAGVSISTELVDILLIKEIGNKTLRYVIFSFKILVMQVSRRQIGSQTFIETLGISS